MKIAVAGTGYVGLSIATLLAQHNKVYAVDIIAEKVEKINNRISPIQDEYIEKYLKEKELNLTATLDGAKAYKDADFVVIAAPTNYDSKKNFFDTSAVEAVIKLVIEYNPDAIMVIKSTIPVGYTASIREKFHCDNIIFSPEFLRESKALYDNLYPSRIIVGTDMNDPRLVEAANTFAGLLQEGAIKEDIETLNLKKMSFLLKETNDSIISAIQSNPKVHGVEMAKNGRFNLRIDNFDDDAVNDVLKDIIRAGGVVKSIFTQEPSLEDVFIKATAEVNEDDRA